jgi:hypothetical protein
MMVGKTVGRNDRTLIKVLSQHSDVRFEVSKAMKIQVVVFWVAMPEDERSMALRNLSILSHNYTMSQPRRTRIDSKASS